LNYSQNDDLEADFKELEEETLGNPFLTQVGKPQVSISNY